MYFILGFPIDMPIVVVNTASLDMNFKQEPELNITDTDIVSNLPG
jgi:hypothetical protein